MEKTDTFSFEQLAESVREINSYAGGRACSAVNRLLTLRNWLIGYYIVEYEQKGKDRAQYGTGLLKQLEQKIGEKGLNETLFTVSRTFYLRYPQLGSAVTGVLPLTPGAAERISAGISATVSQEFRTEPEQLLNHLSFSHIREILSIDDAFERYFYETECIRCGWSVRELRRQISSHLFVRAGLSKKPELLLKPADSTERAAVLGIRDPFAFEFLGLDAKDAVSESDLEQALIDNLQMFLLELGKGFCFEARQKRLTIDDRYYFADLVFYNRVLHCNVIIEIKNDEFKHEYLGQLNSYVGYFRENEMNEGDNPPVGILLCTRKGPKMVEYALSGMDNQLFVSTYLLTLPDKKVLEEFLLRQAD